MPQTKRSMPWRRPVARRELERRGMAEPARQRLAQAFAVHARGVARMRPDEGRRAGAAVQVLVAAADREVGAAPLAGRPALRRPSAPGPRRVSAPAAWAIARQLGHVVDAAAAVVDVRQHQQRDLVGQVQGKVGGVDQAQLQPGGDGDALGDVEVGREVAALGEEHGAPGSVGLLQRDGGAQRLEQVDRGRVAGRDLARRRRRSARAIRSPIAPARSIQPALFQLRIRPSPHSPATVCARRAAVAAAARRASCRRGRSGLRAGRTRRAAAPADRRRRGRAPASRVGDHGFELGDTGGEPVGRWRFVIFHRAMATVAKLVRRRRGHRVDAPGSTSASAGPRDAARAGGERAVQRLLRDGLGQRLRRRPRIALEYAAPFTYIGVRYAIAFAVAMLAFGLRAAWPRTPALGAMRRSPARSAMPATSAAATTRSAGDSRPA